jgi:hypothetical protein
MSEWRRNGTCGACSHFTVDFGEAPEFFGHCKMYQRTGSRDASDATCHEFLPLEGFADKVVLEARTTVPDSSRQRTAPGRTIVGDSAPVIRRRDGETTAPSAEEEAAGAGALAGLLENPGGGLDADVLDLALLDLFDRYGLVDALPLDREFRTATLILQPADRGLKAAEIEVEALFHKVVMVRDRLRLIEQKVNAQSGLTDLQKVELQQHITRAYGAFSGLNAIFRKTAAYWARRRPTRRALELLLRRFDTLPTYELAPKWVGGEVTVKDQDGEVLLAFPIELLFERTAGIKRALEALGDAAKAQTGIDRGDRDAIADYLSKSQGSLTTLNILFRHADDKFSSK